MLRNRSRAVSGKQALMADHSSQSSSSSSFAKPVPNSFFGSPRFRAFAAMGFSETTDYSLISPTSVLDSKPFFSLANPFSYDKKQPPKSPRAIFSGNKQENSEAKAIGLALIEENNDSKPSKSVIISAKLRVQIPRTSLPQDFAVDSPKSPPDFGTKSRNYSHRSAACSGSATTRKYPDMSVKEMKLCEEYTCVRTHGPNAKTTHIFDNCVVKSFVSGSEKSMAAATKNFLSFCHTCKNNLEQTNDIYIYRGEKAFCSHECRYQEMILDGEEDSS